jgi:hypothetical protein
MWRMIVGGLVLVVALYMLVDALIVTDLERVEEEIARLIEVAERGGPEAVDELLAAFADDYRSGWPYDRAAIERYLRTYVATARSRSVDTGSYTAVPAGEEIVVPLLRIDAVFDDARVTTIVRLTFGERDGKWKIVAVNRPGR